MRWMRWGRGVAAHHCSTCTAHASKEAAPGCWAATAACSRAFPVSTGPSWPAAATMRAGSPVRTASGLGGAAGARAAKTSAAIADAGLEESDVINPRTGVVAGSGGPSTSAMLAAHQVALDTGSTKRIGPFAVPKTMCSTISANLATSYKIKGLNWFTSVREKLDDPKYHLLSQLTSPRARDIIHRFMI